MIGIMCWSEQSGAMLVIVYNVHVGSGRAISGRTDCSGVQLFGDKSGLEPCVQNVHVREEDRDLLWFSSSW